MLRDHGYKVEVVTAMPNYPTGRIFPEYKGKILQKEVADGISVRRIWLYPSNSKKVLNRVASMVSQSISLYMLALPHLLKRRPSIVLVSSPPILLGYTGMIIARITGAKAVLNVSDIWPLSALELGYIRPGGFYRYLENLEKRMYWLSHVCVGQSREILDHVEKVLPGRKKKFLYRNLQEVSPYADQPRPAGPKKIVYAGLLGIAQGVLEICRRVNFAALGVEFHIYGEGFEKPAIEQFIKDHPDHGICFHGSIPGKEIPCMLSRHHATLIPLTTLIHGAVPSKIFMAISNALPVLFSGAGEGAEIVRSSGIGWVSEPSDYEGLIENIKRFGSLSKSEYETIRQNCLKLSTGEFNKESQDKLFDEFLQGL